MRRPLTEAPAGRPFTSSTAPDMPIHLVPLSLRPKPNLVMSTLKPWKSRLYCLGRSSQPPSSFTWPLLSIANSLTSNDGQLKIAERWRELAAEFQRQQAIADVEVDTIEIDRDDASAVRGIDIQMRQSSRSAQAAVTLPFWSMPTSMPKRHRKRAI